ncbi:MAG TPA: hypothetical protein VGK19_05810 [Capsulimonadaceae bacterium]|jgi:hypothetical protein
MTDIHKLCARLLPMALLASVAYMVPSPANADVRYTTEMSMVDASAKDKTSGFTMRSTNFSKDGRIRTETSMGGGGFNMQTVTITDCPSRTQYTVDPMNKVYTRKTLDNNRPAFLGNIAAMTKAAKRGGWQPKQKAGTGKEIITYSIEQLEPERILDINTKHYAINMRMQSSGCPGDSDTTMRIESWVADIQAGISCPPSAAKPSDTGGTDTADTNPCKVTTEIHGDTTGAFGVFGKMPLRQKIYMDASSPDKYILMDTREYSKASLDVSNFTIPSDYREVTSDEWDKIQRDSMMKRFSIPGAGGGDDNDKPKSKPKKDDSEDNGDTPAPQKPNKHVFPGLPNGIKLPF